MTAVGARAAPRLPGAHTKRTLCGRRGGRHLVAGVSSEERELGGGTAPLWLPGSVVDVRDGLCVVV